MTITLWGGNEGFLKIQKAQSVLSSPMLSSTQDALYDQLVYELGKQ